jgi:hypothetical protein
MIIKDLVKKRAKIKKKKKTKKKRKSFFEHKKGFFYDTPINTTAEESVAT